MFQNWRDRPQNALWFVFAIFFAWVISAVFQRYGVSAMPGISLVGGKVHSGMQSAFVWRLLVPVLLGGGATLFLMRIVRKLRERSGQVIIEPQHHQQYGPEWK